MAVALGTRQEGPTLEQSDNEYRPSNKELILHPRPTGHANPHIAQDGLKQYNYAYHAYFVSPTFDITG